MRIFIHDCHMSVATPRWPLAGVLGILLVLLAPAATFGQPPSGESSESEYEENYDEEMNSDEYSEEMSYDEYDGSEGSGYGGRSRGRGSASDAMMQSYGSAMSSVLRNVDLNALFAPSSEIPAVAAGPVLSADAEHAYQSGNYPLALELFYGHMATEYEQARTHLQTVSYSKLLRQPVWQIRFGVSFAVRGDLDADPQPIKEGKTPMNRMANGGDGSDGSDYSAEMQQQEEMGMESQMSEMTEEGYGSPQAAGQPKAPPRPEMLSAAANEELEKYLGLVAKVVAEQFETRYRQGDFGTALITVMAPEPVDKRARRAADQEVAISLRPISQEVMDALSDSPEPRPLWRPGIIYYGEGDSADVLKQANRENIDLLLHFDISLKTQRQEKYVQNVSRCRLFHVASGKSLGISKGMDNFEAIRMAQSGRSSERDYVTAQLENLFGILDRSVKTMEMPTLTPEVAKRRIGTLLSGAGSKSLRTLAEVRLYQSQELITAEEVEAAFDIVGGADALLMLHGPLEERLKMARQWAVRAVPKFSE